MVTHKNKKKPAKIPDVTLVIELTEAEKAKRHKYRKARTKYRRAVKKLRKTAKSDILERLFA